ncbi:uncharacterized protein ELE39_001013 [Cryptosporidium sp. chipmunk genotype I]|uniref:uncharacterized protein n=1 Tax=Cryptosporidium sp. chipmunk genotype I TaxID=1280935 RepID=UPI00351A9662|nr:hypothetical protein ELE39_001013 [Cryptosporidium sp. chipmunk genotype I]
MKLRLKILSYLFVLFTLFSGEDHVEINDSQITSFYSFVKVKLKASPPNTENKESEKSVRRKTPTESSRSSSYKSSSAASTGKSQSSPNTGDRSPQKMQAWPPPRMSKKTIKGKPASKPGHVSQKYAWPPEKKEKDSHGQRIKGLSAKSPGEAEIDKEDLYTAIRVQVLEEEDSEPEISRLSISSSDSGTDSDSSVPGTLLEKRTALIKRESELSPEIAEKVKKMKEKTEKTVKRKLVKGRYRELLNDPKLAKKMLLISIPLLIELLKKFLEHFTSRRLTILTLEDIEQLQNSLSTSSQAGVFLNTMESLNQLISELKPTLKEKFEKKYREECSFSFLKTQAELFLSSYMENAEIEYEITKLSNPKEVRVENRGQVLMGLYKQLKETLPRLKEKEVRFLECYLTYLERIDHKNVEATKKEACTWRELLLLNYFFTAFKGYSMLSRESLAKYEKEISEYEKLIQKSEGEMISSERSAYLILEPMIKKLSKLRIDYELHSMIATVLPTVIGKCINHLMGEG